MTNRGECKMPDDVSALVERREDKWKHSEEDGYAAASAIKAQAAEIANAKNYIKRMHKDIPTLAQRAEEQSARAEAAEAKLREAVRLLQGWYDAKSTGRNEPLEIMKDATGNFLSTMETRDE